MLGRMDAEFVEFLDKKFQGLQKSLVYEIQRVEERLGERITRLEEAVENLTNSIDRPFETVRGCSS